jgi:CHASE2 domain-containing sensor protein
VEGLVVDALNILRAVLVAGTFVVALLLAVDGRWMPAAVLGVGILAHFGLWAHLWREKRQEREKVAALGGVAPPQA